MGPNREAHATGPDPFHLRDWFVIDLPEGGNAAALAPEFETIGVVDIASPEVDLVHHSPPNDPLFGDSWGHHNTQQLQEHSNACPGGCVNNEGHCGPNVGVTSPAH